MIEKFAELGIDIKNKTGEFTMLCPKCSHTRKKKNIKCLSINTDKGLYNCHHCGWSGNVNLYEKKQYIFFPFL